MATRLQYQQAYTSFINAHKEAPQFPTTGTPAIASFAPSPAALTYYKDTYNHTKATMEKYTTGNLDGSMKSVRQYLADLNALTDAVDAANPTNIKTPLSTIVQNLRTRAAKVLLLLRKQPGFTLDATHFAAIQPRTEGGSVYANVADLQLYLKNGMQPSLGRFAEIIALNAFSPNNPSTPGEDLIKASLDSKVRDWLRTNGASNVSFTGGAENKKLQKRIGGSGLVDLVLSYTPGGDPKATVTYNISAKHYLPNTTEFKFADMYMNRALQALANQSHESTLLYYALNRAIGADDFGNRGPLQDALRNSLLEVAIFGSGESTIDAFLINNELYNAAEIKKRIQNNTLTPNMKITNLSVPTTRDKYAAQRTTELNSALYYIPYSTIRSIAQARFSINLAGKLTP